ncbi:MAG: hypothetical protein O2820_14050 [Planctomycetota bacterium]|nr:hypothetical protein [Planctomycetota bacterium]MDA1250335.1 hypothetical protein [Planctomycetota bacterium]
MASGCRSLVDFLTALVIGGVCFVASALTLTPDVKPGRNEVRLAQAWIDVRCIRDATIAEGRLSFGDRSPEDPWGLVAAIGSVFSNPPPPGRAGLRVLA